jgi:hypothetical protein
MSFLSTRSGLGSMMLAIAFMATAFTCLGVPGGSTAIVVFGLAYVPIALSPPGRRLAAWGWVFSLYPTLLLGSLYLAWGSAWGVLGHCPLPIADAPSRVGPVVAGVFVTTNFLLFGLPFSFLGCLVLATAESKRRFLATGGQRAAALSAIAGPLVWVAAFAILRWDPFEVMAWFLA